MLFLFVLKVVVGSLACTLAETANYDNLMIPLLTALSIYIFNTATKQ